MKQYKTRLDPPPANGWIPPPLPPIEELLAKESDDSGTAAASKKRAARKTSAAPSVKGEVPNIGSSERRMANLFEEAPTTLFDDEDEEMDPEQETPIPIGPIVINGQAAQLVEKIVLDGSRIQYRVILDSTGESKSFISPPAVVTH